LIIVPFTLLSQRLPARCRRSFVSKNSNLFLVNYLDAAVKKESCCRRERRRLACKRRASGVAVFNQTLFKLTFFFALTRFTGRRAACAPVRNIPFFFRRIIYSKNISLDSETFPTPRTSRVFPAYRSTKERCFSEKITVCENFSAR
jgi:hypothetical protein